MLCPYFCLDSDLNVESLNEESLLQFTIYSWHFSSDSLILLAKSFVICCLLLALLSALLLQSNMPALLLQHSRSPKSLDLRSLGSEFLAPLVQRLHHNRLANIILLRLNSLQTLLVLLGPRWQGCVSQLQKALFTLFHCDRVQDTQVCINNATVNRFALSLSSSSVVTAGMALAEQKADTSVRQDTLLHGEAFVITSTGADSISLPLLTKGITQDLRGHSFLIKCS